MALARIQTILTGLSRALLYVPIHSYSTLSYSLGLVSVVGNVTSGRYSSVCADFAWFDMFLTTVEKKCSVYKKKARPMWTKDNKNDTEIATLQKTLKTVQVKLDAANQTIQQRNDTINICQESLRNHLRDHTEKLQEQKTIDSKNRCTFQQYIRKVHQTEAINIVSGFKQYFHEVAKKGNCVINGDDFYTGENAGFAIHVYVRATRTSLPDRYSVLGRDPLNDQVNGLEDEQQVLAFVLDALEVRELSILSEQQPFHLVFDIDQKTGSQENIYRVSIQWSSENQSFTNIYNVIWTTTETVYQSHNTEDSKKRYTQLRGQCK